MNSYWEQLEVERAEWNKKYMDTIKSAFLSISSNDVVKAVAVAILTPVAGYIIQVLQVFVGGGSFAINWSLVLHYALAGFVGYLAKQFLTNSQGQLLTGEPQ